MGHKGESSAETRCRGFLILEYQCFFSIGIAISDVVAFCPLKKYLAITMLWAICLHFSMRWCFSPRISMFFLSMWLYWEWRDQHTLHFTGFVFSTGSLVFLI